MAELLDNRRCLNEAVTNSDQSVSGKTTRTNVRLNFDNVNPNKNTENSSKKISNYGNVTKEDGEVVVGTKEVVDYG